MQQAHCLLRTDSCYSAERTYQALKAYKLNEVDDIRKIYDNRATSTTDASRYHSLT